MAKSDKKNIDIKSGNISRSIEIKGLDEKKNEALNKAILQIEKDHGKGKG